MARQRVPLRSSSRWNCSGSAASARARDRDIIGEDIPTCCLDELDVLIRQTNGIPAIVTEARLPASLFGIMFSLKLCGVLNQQNEEAVWVHVRGSAIQHAMEVPPKFDWDRFIAALVDGLVRSGNRIRI